MQSVYMLCDSPEVIAQKLCAFVDSHCPPIPTTYCPQRKKLHVHCEWVHVETGERGIESSYIQPTLKAVRAYLNY